MKVRDFMTWDPETIGPQDLLSVAREKMERGGFRRLPVVNEDGALLGIVTDRDLREHAGYLQTTRVTAAMVEKPVIVQPDMPIAAAAKLMLERKIRGLPVVDADQGLIGIITETDVVLGLLRRLPEET